MLSPTLPLAIEEELKKLGTGSQNGDSSGLSSAPSSVEKKKVVPSSSDKYSRNSKDLSWSDAASKESSSPLSSPTGLGITFKSEKPQSKPSPSAPEKRHVPTERKVSSIAPIFKPTKPDVKYARADTVVNGTRSTPSTIAPEEAESFVVKLKYPKNRKTHVEWLLKLKPTNTLGLQSTPKEPPKIKDASKSTVLSSEKKHAVDRDGRPNNAGKTSDDDVKGVARKAPVSGSRTDRPTPTSASKRPRADDEAQRAAPPAKRQKAPNALELDRDPRTPIQPPQPSPALSSNKSSALKAHMLTPKNSFRAAAMKRTESSESFGTTPKGLATTPVNSTRSESGKKQPTSAPLSGQAGAWHNVGKELNAAAYKLKRATQDVMSSGEPGSQKKVAVMSLESVL